MCLVNGNNKIDTLHSSHIFNWSFSNSKQKKNMSEKPPYIQTLVNIREKQANMTDFDQPLCIFQPLEWQWPIRAQNAHFHEKINAFWGPDDRKW